MFPSFDRWFDTVGQSQWSAAPWGSAVDTRPMARKASKITTREEQMVTAPVATLVIANQSHLVLEFLTSKEHHIDVAFLILVSQPSRLVGSSVQPKLQTGRSRHCASPTSRPSAHAAADNYRRTNGGVLAAYSFQRTKPGGGVNSFCLQQDRCEAATDNDRVERSRQTARRDGRGVL
ncbi:hypothetical protein BV25DRAFT_1836514 [Artomyces pyxidatus]|uniref:Uncharacterized protein n=1 Tax=Artomyces pyxidatus TaxID=48021 RepID=A0ACB8T9Q7_9AGAM|nr:hypothetical protein BV25DRAFT_1836514 [Artomyces pyxidatus]